MKEGCFQANYQTTFVCGTELKKKKKKRERRKKIACERGPNCADRYYTGRCQWKPLKWLEPQHLLLPHKERSPSDPLDDRDMHKAHMQDIGE